MIIERYIGMRSGFVFRPMAVLKGKNMTESFQILYCFKKIERHGQKSMHQVAMEMDWSKSSIFDKMGTGGSFQGKPFPLPVPVST